MNKIIYATKDLFCNYVNFRGRLSRAGYWWAYLGYFLLSIVLNIVIAVTGFQWLLAIFGLVFFLPLLSAAVRRFHDTGRSGIQILVIYFLDVVFIGMMIISVIGTAVSGVTGNSSGLSGNLIFMFVAIIGIIGASVYFFVALVSRGNDGANRYGEVNPFYPDQG